MKEALEYLKSCKTFYLATCEDSQPRVRPFGAVCEFEDKLYIITNNQKKVYAQLLKNPKVEISGMDKGTWIRIEGEVKPDERIEAKTAMIKDNEEALGGMYSPNDDLMAVFYFTHGTATVYSFTEEPKVFKF